MSLSNISTVTIYGQRPGPTASTATLTVTEHSDGSWSFTDGASGKRVDVHCNPAFEALVATINNLV